MKIEVTQCSMCTHYNTEQFCEVWQQYISNDAFYCACGVKADRKTEPKTEVIACPIIDDDAWIYTDEPQKCETCKHYDTEVEAIACERCLDGKYSRYEPQTCENRECKNYDTINDHCMFIEQCNYEPKTEPQADNLIEQADEMIKFDKELLQMDEEQMDDGTAFIKRHELRVDYGDEVPYDLKPFIDW